MTDMPSFGVLCCGKDIDELSRSVRCCSQIGEIMKKSGYTTGGYHTSLIKDRDPAKMKLCGEKLFHLASLCDVVFTVGQEGFSGDDVMPEITLKLCESEAVFFSGNLCGLSNIGNYDNGSCSKRTKKAFPPSRSRAGILKNCLVMNIRADEVFIANILPTLLPSISFAVMGLCGKNAENSVRIHEQIIKTCEKKKQ